MRSCGKGNTFIWGHHKEPPDHISGNHLPKLSGGLPTTGDRSQIRHAWVLGEERLLVDEWNSHTQSHWVATDYCLVRLIVMFMFKHAADVAFKDSRRSRPKNPPLAV